MSSDRRSSFVVYGDSTDPTVEHLNMEQRGQFFTALLDYRAGRPIEIDGLLRAVVAPFFAAMDRDDAKFNAKVAANKANGAKGGRPRKVEENPKNPTVILESQKTREGEGEGEGEGKESKKDIVAGATKKPAANALNWAPLNLNPEHLEAVQTIRKKHGSKGKVSQRVIDTLGAEFAKGRTGGLTDEQMIAEWDTRGWVGFKAEWLLKDARQGMGKAQGMSRDDHRRERTAQACHDFVSELDPVEREAGNVFDHEPMGGPWLN